MQGTVLVTGAAGFIGSHLSRALLDRGVRVVGVDNFDPYYDVRVKRANVAELAAHASGAFRLVECDITDRGALAAVFQIEPISGVIHLAARAGVRPSIADPAGYMHTNVTGTANVFAIASEKRASRVVMASSSSVYGNCPVAPFREDMDVNAPISPYAVSKRACELLAHTHHHLTKLPIACLRFFTVYGPNQRPDLAIASFLDRVSRGQSIKLFGDGSSARDYTFVDDIVSGILASYERIPSFGYRVWNLGNSNPVTLNEMLATIESVVGRKAVVDRQPMQPGDVELTYADLTRSASELGFAPLTTFADGVDRQYRAAVATSLPA